MHSRTPEEPDTAEVKGLPRRNSLIRKGLHALTILTAPQAPSGEFGSTATRVSNRNRTRAGYTDHCKGSKGEKSYRLHLLFF